MSLYTVKRLIKMANIERRDITLEEFDAGDKLMNYVIETPGGKFQLRDYQRVALNQFIGLCGWYHGVIDSRVDTLMSIEVISSDLESIGDQITGKQCTRYYVLPKYSNMRFWIHGAEDGSFILVRDDGISSKIYKE